jgi:hypothetical protein
VTETSSAVVVLALITVTVAILLLLLSSLGGHLRLIRDPEGVALMDPMTDLAMITLVDMNAEWVEGVVMQMIDLVAGFHLDLQADIKMEFLIWMPIAVMQICQVEVLEERG